MTNKNTNITRGFEPVIGLEIHAQLKTNTKLFCSCTTKFGAEPNSQVCPVCLAMPGVLPVLNKRAVEYAVMMGLATNCRVNLKSVFARKNYFYPDLPKGYQISQYDEPVCEGGYVDIEVKDAGPKRIGLTRIHMEEDAGKLQHGSGPEDSNFSFVDLNRACTPLIEIVSEPDIRNANEAVAYLKTIRDIVVYLGVCDGNMDEGSFRCDANISVRPVGREEFGTRTELKNINSFKFVKDAINYEIERQVSAIEDGEKIVQETRLYDSSKGVTLSMRSKEEAHDYRYFPEPDLLPLVFDSAFVEEARSKLPELPGAKRARFISEYSLPAYDAGVLTASRDIADFYETTVKRINDPKTVSNWVMGELMRLLNDEGIAFADCKVTSESLAELLSMLKDNEINARSAKEVFEEVFKTGKGARAVVKQKGVTQISDSAELSAIIDEILSADPASLERYKNGEKKLLGFFVGQVMKKTRGQGNPKTINALLREKLDS